MRKPKKANKDVDRSTDNSERKDPQIRVAKSVYRKQVLKRVVAALGYTILISVVVYACFAATILRVIPATNSLGPTPIKNITFKGGVAPIGSKIVVDTQNTVETGTFDRLTQAFIPKSSVALVEVAAGPTGSISWAESGLITIDGETVGVTVKADPGEGYLRNQYVVKCIKGDCAEGAGFIISMDQVYGEPL